MAAMDWFVLPAAGVGVVLGPMLDRVVESMNPDHSDGRSAGERPTLRARRWRIVALSITMGALLVGAVLRYRLSWTLPPVAIFLVGAVLLASSDARYYLLPKRIQWPTVLVSGALLVAAAAATSQWGRLGVAVISGAVAFAVFFAMNLINPKGMAFGDVRLAGTIGLVVGWLGVPRVVAAFFFASLTAALVAVSLLVARRIRYDSHLPYGVFLALGAVVALLG